MAKTRKTRAKDAANDTETRKRTKRPFGGWVGVVKGKPGFYWRGKDPNGKTVQRGSYETTDEAERALYQFLAAEQKDPASGLKERTLSKVVEEYLVVAGSRVSVYHAGVVKKQLQRFVDSVGDAPVVRVTRPTVESYMQQLSRERGQPRTVEGKTDAKGDPLVVTPRMSPNTQRHHLAALGGLFAFALDRQYVAINPARGIKLARVQQHVPFVFTAEQLAKLYPHVPERARDLVVFLAGTGCRLSEGLALQWSAVADDFSAVTISQTKSGASRRIPVGSAVAALLKARHERHVAPMRGADRVFPEMKRWSALKNFHRGTAAAGLPRNATIHSLRHSYAVGLTMAGVPFSVTCRILGHSTPAFTASRYARWVPDGEEARAVAALDAVRSAVPPTVATTA